MAAAGRFDYAQGVRVDCSFCCRHDGADGYVAGYGVGPDGRLYILECLGPKDESWINRKAECDWRVLSVGPDGDALEYLIESQIRNYNLIQPLPDGLLLAGSRCEFDDEEVVPNGHVFALDGTFLRTMLLGDGIQKIHSTPKGDVWVSYFDEGVFGNLGWRRPLGSRGLLRFDATGNRVFEFDPVAGLDTIVDCYALNAVGNSEAWCYYYTQFSVVHIQNDRVIRHWPCPISGASELAVWRDVVSMPDGYNATKWKVLRLLEAERTDVAGEIEFIDQSGQPLSPGAATCRGDVIWFIQNGEIHRASLRDLH